VFVFSYAVYKNKTIVPAHERATVTLAILPQEDLLMSDTRDAITLDTALLSRRSFLGLGLTGAVALSSTGVVTTLTGCSTQPASAAKGFSFLRDGDLQLFKALIPAVLGDAIHTDSHNYQALVTNILQKVDGACANLGNKAQTEVHKLLDLLDTRLTRWLTTGIYAHWADVSVSDMNKFLVRWRDSSIGPFNAGYRVLSKLVAVSYYGLPESRAYSGYPGPLAAMYQVVNA
jgi:hypothetical protein